MDDTLFGELKIYMYVQRVALIHEDARYKQRTKRVLLQAIPCYYSARKTTLERFKDANQDINWTNLFAEFTLSQMVD